MESDGVTEANASVETHLRAREGASNHDHSQTAGQEASLAAQGVSSQPIIDTDHDEDTPLLQRGVLADSSTEPEETTEGGKWLGMEEFEGLPWWKKPSIFWILGPFLLFALAFGGIIVPKIDLILNLVCRKYYAERAVSGSSNPAFGPDVFAPDKDLCGSAEVQSRVAQFTLYCNLCAGILSAITSPKLGALSDRYGRRRIIVLSTCGMLLAEVITIITATWPDHVSVNWILFGYVLDGLSGSFIAGMALINSYATDCTPPSKRNEVFGYFHGCLFIGIAAGPIIAGYIVKWTGSILSIFYVTLVDHLFFICFLTFIIPESLSRRRQMAAREKHRAAKEANKADENRSTTKRVQSFIDSVKSANLLAPLTILYPTGEGSSTKLRRNMLLLAAIDTAMFGVAMGSLTVVVIYSQYQFGWDVTETSTFISIVNFGRVIMLFVVLPLVTRLVRGRQKIGSHRNMGSDWLDLSLMRVAIFFDTLGYLGYTLARSGPLFILSGVVASIGGIGSPTIQSALTKSVPPDRTGQLLGAIGLLHALARVVSPTVFNLVYSLTVGRFTQTIFVGLTATFGVAFVLSCFVRPHVFLEEPDALMSPERSEEIHEEVGRE